MNRTASVRLARFLAWITAGILLLLPFHAFLTVWLSSLVGHYTLLRLWKEFLLVPLVLGAVYIVFTDGPLRKRLFSLWLTRLILAYTLLVLVCAFTALALDTVSSKAMWYGLLLDLRFLVFFLAAIVIASKAGGLGRNWQKILLGPAIIVAAFAVLQYLVLPADFLRHFGYGPATISPYETINHNQAHIRVASTLRGANPLGAYLILPICALGVWLFKEKRERRDKAILAGGLLATLAFSFSRSAWIGTALGLAVITWFSFTSFRARKKIGWGLAITLAATCLLVLVLRNNLSFENAVFHTDRQSQIAVSSNEGHASAFKSAAKDIVRQPLGGGVGTAGPQSVYSIHQARIAENYFLQIGQEAGMAGMALFIAVCAVLGKMLYVRRADPLALALLAALIGLSFVNLLSHAWTDDTLAYIYWGLAAICLAPALKKNT